MRAVLLTLLLSATAGAAEVNGFAYSRTQWSEPRLGGLLPTRDLPLILEMLELNTQLRQSYLPGGYVYGDVSAFLQAGGTYRTQGADGEEVVVGDHPTAATRPFFSLNELYLTHEFLPELNVLVGKKRLVWGSGIAFNPTDLLNPPKDPTDPSLQRTGAWMARVEVPLESAAFTLLFSPQVTSEASGLPTHLLYQPSWQRTDEEAHFLLAARAYALVRDSDVNLMLFYSNRYGDAFEDKLRFGGSFSKVFDALEVHAEALLHLGSSRAVPGSACLSEERAAFACLSAGTPLFSLARLESNDLHARALAGARYLTENETLLSAEYLFQSDGYTPAQFQSVVNALTLAEVARQRGLEPPELGPFGASGSASGSTRFTFEPLGQHYLFLTLQRPRIAEDFTLTLVWMSSLQDLSGLLAPSLAWSATEWLTVTASAFLPYAGPASLGAVRADTGAAVHEYSLVPIKARAMLELRAFY